MSSILISLGSNLGDREKNIKHSIRLLEEKCLILKKSSLYETEPVSDIKQDWFLNAVIEVKTKLSPEELLDFLLSIEKRLGRIRSIKDGPREIDLDIIFYGDKTYNGEKLIIPHPRMEQRKFVLEPLKEICPDLVHPVLGMTITELFNNLEKEEVVDLYKKTF